MANKDYDVSVEKQKLLDKWNPAPVDHALEHLVGVPNEPGDVAATATVPMTELNRHINPSSSDVDAARLGEYEDDGDDGAAPDDGLDDLGKKDLQKQAAKRGLPKAGNKDDLKARIREFDAQQG